MDIELLLYVYLFGASITGLLVTYISILEGQFKKNKPFTQIASSIITVIAVFVFWPIFWLRVINEFRKDKL